MPTLAEAIDRVIVANTAYRKRRALAKPERTLKRAMAAAFLAEGRVVLAELAFFESRFPGKDTSTKTATFAFQGAGLWAPVRANDLVGAYDRAVANSVDLFTLPIDTAAATGLESGMASAVTDLNLSISFDLKHPRAVEYMKDHGLTQITRIRATTRETLRAILVEAVDEGWSYNRTAAAIKKRYRHFSRERARNIAVYELGDAYEAGNRMIADDLVYGGLRMEKSWLAVGDAKTRPAHQANDDAGWIPIDDTFPSGHDRPPTDPRCLPGDCRVSAEGVTATSKRRYEGDFVVIFTASNKQLSCTPNHPILTPIGWVAAGILKQGDDVISSGGREWVGTVGNLNDDHMPATIKEVTGAFRRTSEVTARPVVAAPAFHGDGKGSKVAVIRSNGFLRDSRYATIREHGHQISLMARIRECLGLACLRGQAQRLKAWRSAASGAMSFFCLAPPLLRRHLLPLHPLGFTLIADRYSGLGQSPANNLASSAELFGNLVLRDTGQVERDDLFGRNILSVASHSNPNPAKSSVDELLRDTQLARDLLDGSAGEVFADKIIRVDWEWRKTHVYNLETVSGAYIAEGIITHNCRCAALYRRKPSA